MQQVWVQVKPNLRSLLVTELVSYETVVKPPLSIATGARNIENEKKKKLYTIYTHVYIVYGFFFIFSIFQAPVSIAIVTTDGPQWHEWHH